MQHEQTMNHLAFRAWSYSKITEGCVEDGKRVWTEVLVKTNQQLKTDPKYPYKNWNVNPKKSEIHNRKKFPGLFWFPHPDQSHCWVGSAPVFWDLGQNSDPSRGWGRGSGLSGCLGHEYLRFPRVKRLRVYLVLCILFLSFFFANWGIGAWSVVAVVV
jgi:hypothetical protein